MIAASGVEYVISRGAYRASIASVGATLRELTHDGRHLVTTFAVDEVRPYYRGVTLAPWPNRVTAGRYTFDGAPQALPLTEPERGQALHGLACWLQFEPVYLAPDRVVLAATIQPQAGYPHRVALAVTFSLEDQGLMWKIDAENVGPNRAPYGASVHPYLVAGNGRVDDWILELPAASFLATDELLSPTHAVTAGEPEFDVFDFRSARPIGKTFIDHAFGDVLRDRAGRTVVRLLAADGRGVSLSWDERCPWVQIHTADLPNDAISRLGLAVEPMTCPPDAFNSGTDLVVLDPGEHFEVACTIAAIY